MPEQKPQENPSQGMSVQNYYREVERRVTKDAGLPIGSVMQRWDFLVMEELFAAPADMTIGEFREMILMRLRTEKTPGTE